ncbi:Aminotransferase-like [Vigna unguiculata]|uniref:Aminotransferase-like n=1 Tax=Vigna unguiculata TaxID=3917 RepID=A0A4D6KLJ7_VIGUN|nr:Aminotransferase-like [Vigna unguiculata]
MEPSPDNIIEAKEELMVSPLSGENPIRRTAYFIKPCMEGSANPPHYMFSSGRTATVDSNHAKLPLEVIYSGWCPPHQEWNTWSMEPSPDNIIEAKEELMVSPLSGENPIRRTAYFIKPCMEGSANPPHYMFSSGRTATVDSNHAKLPLEVIYSGWCPPHQEWNTWLYNENDKWVCKNPNFDDELESFARCMRLSELVGMECVEHYCPNRVAMQFGMDQDIPGMLVPHNENPWISYSEPVTDTNLYIVLSARQKPNVSSRYYHWWKQSNQSKEGSKHYDCVESSSKHALPISLYVKKESSLSCGPPPGFTCKIKRKQEHDFDEMQKGPIIELSSSSTEGTCVRDEEVENVSSPVSVVFPSLSFEEARRSVKDDNGVKINNLFCDRDGVSDVERKYASPCIEEISSDLESRIGRLERVVAKLKAEKIGYKV